MARFECKICGYIFDEQQAGIKFSEITECPICAESRDNFVLMEEEEKPKAVPAEEKADSEKKDSEKTDSEKADSEKTDSEKAEEKKEEDPFVSKGFVIEKRQEFWLNEKDKEQEVDKSNIETYYGDVKPVKSQEELDKEAKQKEEENRPRLDPIVGSGAVQKVIDGGDRSSDGSDSEVVVVNEAASDADKGGDESKAEDADAKDTESKDAEAEGTGVKDAEAKDAEAEDTGVKDSDDDDFVFEEVELDSSEELETREIPAAVSAGINEGQNFFTGFEGSPTFGDPLRTEEFIFDDEEPVGEVFELDENGEEIKTDDSEELVEESEDSLDKVVDRIVQNENSGFLPTDALKKVSAETAEETPVESNEEIVDENSEELIRKALSETEEETSEEDVPEWIDGKETPENEGAEAVAEEETAEVAAEEETVEAAAGEVAEETVETAAEEAVETVVEGVAEETVEAAAEEVVEETVEAAEEETVEAVVEEAAEETVEAAEKVAEAAAEEVVEETVETAAEEAVETVVEEAAEETVETVVEETVEAAAEEVVEETFEAAAEEAVETVVEEAAEETVEAAAEEVAEETVEIAAEEAAEETVEAAAEEVAEETVETAAEEAAEETVEAAAEEVAEETVETAAEEAVETVAEEKTAETVAEETIEKTEEKPAVEKAGIAGMFAAAAAAVSEKFAEVKAKVKGEAVEETAEEVKETTEDTAGEAAKEVTEAVAEEVAEETAGEAAKEVTEAVAEEVAEETVGKVVEEATEEVAEETTEEPVEAEEVEESAEDTTGTAVVEDRKYSLLNDNKVRSLFVLSGVGPASNGLEGIVLLPAQLDPMPMRADEDIHATTVIGKSASTPVRVSQPFGNSELFIWGEYVPNSGGNEDLEGSTLVLVKGKNSHIPCVSGKEELRKEVEKAKELSLGSPVGISLMIGRIEQDLAACAYAGVDYVILNDVSSGMLPYALRRAKNYLSRVNSGIEIIVSINDVNGAQEVAKLLALGAVFVLLEREYDEITLERITTELKEIARNTGHKNVQDLNMYDICTIDTDLAANTDIQHF